MLVDHSRFGTWVNGARVRERATVRPGDRVRVGTPGVEFTLISAAAAARERRAVKKRRAFEVFTLSFLDCICCGFGAVVLFYTIVQAQKGAQEILRLNQLSGEVSKLEEEVKEGTRDLVQLRNTLEKTDEDAAAAQARAIRVAQELKERREQSSTFDGDSIARRAHINQLMADIKSLEEGVKRLQGGALDKAPAGTRVKSFRGRGNRKYISALQMKGKRILVLLDTSASMMDEDVVKVLKLRNQPEAARRAALKWRRSLDMVEWMTAQLPDNSQFQVYGFNTKAKTVLGEQRTDNGSTGNDPRAINNVLTAARAITPGDGTSLVNALLSVRTLTPQPDQIILITDGLPTQGSVPPSRKFVNGRDREKLFDDAMKVTDRKLPIDVVLLPMKGDTARGARILAARAALARVVRHSLARLAMRHTTWLSVNAANSKSSRCRSSTASAAVSARSSCCWCSPTSASPSSSSAAKRISSGRSCELQRQLFELRGETDVLNRELQGRTKVLTTEQQRAAALAGDLTKIRGEFKASKGESAVTNIVETELVAAHQTLTAEMQRLLKNAPKNIDTTLAVGGIPVDSEYIIFVVDTSGSMQADNWENAQNVMKEILDIYPKVKGLQILDDEGKPMFSSTRGQWLQDTSRAARQDRLDHGQLEVLQQLEPGGRHRRRRAGLVGRGQEDQRLRHRRRLHGQLHRGSARGGQKVQSRRPAGPPQDSHPRHRHARRPELAAVY